MNLQTEMSSTRHSMQDSCGSQLESLVLSKFGACSKTLCRNGLEGKRIHSLAGALATLPRGKQVDVIICLSLMDSAISKKLAKSRSNSLIDSTGSEPHRRIVVIVKQDNEPFGFEIQTYRLQYEHGTEMKTYVCKVHDNSPSSHAGLKAGDMLTNVNGINTEGFSHQQTVELIRSSGNFLRLETENSVKIRRSELQAKLLLLKDDYRSKWKELQIAVRKEHQLLYGTINESKIHEELDCIHSKIFETHSTCSFLNKHRLSSSSSGISWISSVILNGEGRLGSMSEFDEDSGAETLSRQSSIEEDSMLHKAIGLPLMKSSLSRHRSISITSSESEPMSPIWDSISLSNVFGTLPRKTRKGSVRKNFLKFIPGLHRSVEEEDSSM